ncbi:MAG: hypothetical protein PHX37_00760 [Eubacteriales bacterium]|nr:hypothetical protein [Eubacteriales bacterium]
MTYIKKTFKFLLKNYFIVLPIVAAVFLSALIMGRATANGLALNWFRVTIAPTKPFAVLGLLWSAITSQYMGILGMLLMIVAVPATVGMIFKASGGRKAALNDIVPSVSQHIVQYLIYLAGVILLGLAGGLLVLIIALLFGLISLLLKGFGIFLFVLVLIALGLAYLAITVLLSFWMPSMLIDNTNVVDGAKLSYAYAKPSFWVLAGNIILINIAGALAGWLFGLILGWIPFIGMLLSAIVQALTTVFMTTFIVLLYLEKTGRTVTE